MKAIHRGIQSAPIERTRSICGTYTTHMLTHLRESESDDQQAEYCVPIVLHGPLLANHGRRGLPAVDDISEYALHVKHNPERDT